MASESLDDFDLGIDSCSKLQSNCSPPGSDESDSPWCLHPRSGFPCWSHLKPVPGWRSCLRSRTHLRNCIRIDHLRNHNQIRFHNVRIIFFDVALRLLLILLSYYRKGGMMVSMIMALSIGSLVSIFYRGEFFNFILALGGAAAFSMYIGMIFK